MNKILTYNPLEDFNGNMNMLMEDEEKDYIENLYKENILATCWLVFLTKFYLVTIYIVNETHLTGCIVN